MRGFLDQAILKYTSILISQPFEVAKTVLQCQYVPRREGKSKHHQHSRGFATSEEQEGDSEEEETKAEAEENPWTTFEEGAEDSDDEPKYFASTASPDASPTLRPSRAPATGPKKMTDRAGYVLEDKEGIPRPDYQIQRCSSGAVNEALKALWNKEGAWGIWKGTNATFIYSVLASTMESWTTSFISAVLSLPDPGVTEIADSTHPMASLAVAVAASTLTALLLSPLDVIRTKLILTPSTSKPRNLLPALRALPSYFISTSLILPTTLHAAIPSLISLTTPYFLKTKLNLDPLLTPHSFNFFAFLSSTVEMFVRLPLETVLRRAQIAEAKPERTIVPVGRYAGVIGTAWVLMKEEERGKWGFEGLYRGWRVMAWSNAGVLGLGMLGVQGGTTHEF
ncbi:mitochondrial carrier [Wilcoxina mikolae CBS 423.85]|nr:mitochondrial carrier [Wilcoxina mikolae CBS 423.85]